ncbi:hypothetical protein [Cellulomonas massiliensis]|uniref:hypothetical protein n=1 Tax=Cellulomonas massiliensis TaxID=1465811 RepID=UPI0002DD1AAD|nr:hypothetical protein [Cellulomonas massiliensis]
MTFMNRLRGRRDDDGMALIMVLGVTTMLAALVVAGIAYAMGAQKRAASDQQWSGALAAAYAGIDEYQSRLMNDLSYWNYGNPASPFSSTSTLTLPTGGAANPAFGLGATGTWATVPGSGGDAQFRYEVDNSKYRTATGTLRLRATGRVGDETRTIVADLKQQGFIDFLYFTDFEVSDPTASNPTSTLDCAKHAYDPGGRPSGCNPIYFGGYDTIKGPLHSNDMISTNGAASFQGRVTTAYKATSGANYNKTGSGTPTFKYAGDPTNTGSIGMPPTNSQLKKETRSDLPAEVPQTGCLYTGPTKITFYDDGTMTVVSPWTKFTNTGNAAGTVGTNPPKCGTPGSAGLAATTGTGTSRVYVGQRIPVPANTVIYVQNVPTTTTNVNYTASTTTPPYPTSGANACATSGNSLGFPTKNSSGTLETVPFAGAYGCRNGDVFVEGRVNASATIGAENYIYVTGDLTYKDSSETSDDLLGLVGQNAVFVWNPFVSSTPILTKERTIHAAILSVQHTFMVQNYDKGSANRGTLTVFGAIAQKFRGPVGTGSGASISTGYGKNYTYDPRFQWTAPPKFLSPVTTTYGVTVWVETAPAMNPDGTAR